jgi:WD40 repeat protein
MKKICLILILLNFAFAKELKPVFTLETRALVYDFVLDGSKLFVANDMGTIEVFNLFKKEKVDEIVLPPVFTVQGERTTPKIISVDRLKGKTLFVSTTLKGFREVWLHDGFNLKKIIKQEDKLSIRKAKFVNDEKFVLGTIGHEMILYDTSDSFKVYRKHIEESAFSDVMLSEDKKTMVSSSESGRVSLMDVKTGKVLNKFESQNVDNIYKISYKNGTIITAGQDRRVAVYRPNEEPYYIKSDFLVYSVGLNPSATVGVYSSGEENHLQVFDIKSKKMLNRLVGHKSVPTNIKFFNDKELFSSGDENKIFYWKID